MQPPSIPVQSQPPIASCDQPIAGGQPTTQAVNAPPGSFTCATGTIQAQSGIGIPFAGQFFLVNPLTGQRMAALNADQVNLASLVGQVATVCGVSQGEIEGLTTLRVTSSTPVGPGITPTPPPPPSNPQTLQQLLLQLITSNPQLLLQLVGALQSGGPAAGWGAGPGAAPFGFGAPMAGGQNPFGSPNPFGNPFSNGSVAGIPLPQGVNGNL